MSVAFLLTAAKNQKIYSRTEVLVDSEEVPEAESDVEIALREALANTITHGHQENPESTSMSHAAVRLTKGQAL
jgi:anti-sigma regulatory factor (Ser/Thr protein kinase)